MLKKTTSSPKIDEAVARSVDFELTIADMARRSERRAWTVAGGAVLVSLVLLGGYFYVLPLKEKVPYLVMADAYTGTSTVARLTDDVALKRITSSEAINRSNVTHFILARESYDISFINAHDWITVLTMSSKGVGGAYTRMYASKDSDNPYVLYGKTKALRVRILSTTLTDSSNAQSSKGGATVRFERSVYDKQTGVSTVLDNKIATLTFTYDPNLQMTEQQRVENPLGFQVTEYHVDNDYASPLPSSSKAQDEAGSAMPDATQPPAAMNADGPLAPQPGQLPASIPQSPIPGGGAAVPATPVAPSGAAAGGNRR
ncbi:MAG TPA: VirB8/TrbF family protein [Noviherbaspirillum sp.]